MTVAREYVESELQINRPQPMYDRGVNRAYREIFFTSPAENPNLLQDFKDEFLKWLGADELNRLSGWESGWELDACIGCTQFIDDLYQMVGQDRLMTFEKDYTYHKRLNPEITYTTLETLDPTKELLIAMPFPFYGDKHPQMDEILDRCKDLGIPVHIDGAWVGGSRDIEFDFSHPAIESFAISLSKAMGLGGNRIGLRFTKNRKPGPITIMNDFHMNCQSLLHVGVHFMRKMEMNYFWKKYGDYYQRICKDFNLTPTKAIHLAKDAQLRPTGLRPLLRYLGDK